MTATLLAGGYVFDGTTFVPQDLSFADGVIVASSDSDLVVNVEGKYLIPGLIDSHFHLISRSNETVEDDWLALSMIEGVVNAAARFAGGVTAVRDCGCRHGGIYPLRSALNAGLIAGPRAYVAGQNPTGEKAPAHWRNVVVSGAEQMRAEVRRQHAAGADWVKLILAHAENPFDWSAVTAYLTEEEILAAVDEARQLGIHIGCHCEGYETSALAVRSGLDSLEHAPLVSAETAAEMATRGVVYVPTVWAFSGDAGVDLESLSARELDDLTRWQAEHRRSVARAHEAGVTIACGSDAEGSLPDRHVLLNEMRTLIDCGLSTLDVLRGATSVGAALMGRSDLGCLTVGAGADIVVLDVDPLVSVEALAEPRQVYSRGRLVYEASRPLPPLSAAARQLVSVTARWGDG